MAYRYVEITIGKGVSVSLATDGRTPEESMDKARKQYPEFPVAFCADLSTDTAERFARLDSMRGAIVTITLTRLQKVIGELLEEGERIIKDQLASGPFYATALRARFVGTPLNDIPGLLEYDVINVQGRPSISFEKDEAMSFMATMIREGMAQALREVVVVN